MLVNSPLSEPRWQDVHRVYRNRVSRSDWRTEWHYDLVAMAQADTQAHRRLDFFDRGHCSGSRDSLLGMMDFGSLAAFGSADHGMAGWADTGLDDPGHSYNYCFDEMATGWERNGGSVTLDSSKDGAARVDQPTRRGQDRMETGRAEKDGPRSCMRENADTRRLSLGGDMHLSS
jgi:hypothetical protein